MARTAYWIAHETASWPGTPTGAQIAAGNLSNNSAAAFAGSESFTETTGAGQITEQTAVSGASAGTGYTIAWVIYDDAADDYSGVATGTITTAAVHNESVSDPASATDQPSATATRAASVTDPASASDEASAFAVFLRSITEPASAADNTDGSVQTSGAPTLSNLTASSITQTSVRLTVDVEFA